MGMFKLASCTLLSTLMLTSNLKVPDPYGTEQDAWAKERPCFLSRHDIIFLSHWKKSLSSCVLALDSQWHSCMLARKLLTRAGTSSSMVVKMADLMVRIWFQMIQWLSQAESKRWFGLGYSRYGGRLSYFWRCRQYALITHCILRTQ